MKTTTQHTPTPWTVRLSKVNTGSFYEIEKNGFPVATLGARQGGRADAKFIIRAVNSHEALLRIVKKAVKWTGCITENERIEMEKAIAQAEARS